MAKKKKNKKSNDSVTLLAEALSKVEFDAAQAAVGPLRDDMKEMEARLNTRIDGVVEQLNTRMDGLEKQIQTTNENMSAQFAEQERKIGKSLEEDMGSPDSNGSGVLRPPSRQP